MTLLLALLLACQTPVRESAPEPVVEQVAPADRVQAMREGLNSADGDLRGGDRKAAAAEVRQVYDTEFSPLEPMLRAHDAQTCLELEYAFGVLAHRVEQRRSGVDLGTEGQALLVRVSAAVTAAETAAAEAAAADEGPSGG